MRERGNVQRRESTVGKETMLFFAKFVRNTTQTAVKGLGKVIKFSPVNNFGRVANNQPEKAFVAPKLCSLCRNVVP